MSINEGMAGTLWTVCSTFIKLTSLALNFTQPTNMAKSKNGKSFGLSPHRADSSETVAGAYRREDLNTANCADKSHHLDGRGSAFRRNSAVKVDLADVTDNFVRTDIADDASSEDCSDSIRCKGDEENVEFVDISNGGTASSEKTN